MIALYSVFFLIWLLYTYKTQGITPFFLLLLIYFTCSGVSIVLWYTYGHTLYSREMPLEGIVYHLLIISICFQPLSNIFAKLSKSSSNVQLCDRGLLIMSFLLIAINIPTLLISSITLRETLSQYSMNMGDIRNSFYRGEISGGGGFNFLRLAAATSVFSLVPFFELISKNRYKKYKWIVILLFISSLNIIVDNLKAMSRDGIFIWVTVISSLFLIYRKYLRKISKTKFAYVFLAFVGMLYVFYLITISRADSMTGEYNDSLFFFLYYVGQSFVYFPFYFEQILDGGNFVPDNVFITFVSSFLANFGIIGTLFIAIMFNVLANMAMKKKSLTFMMVLVFLIYFFFFGVLYAHYYFTNRGTLLSMIIVITFSFFISRLYELKINK